MDGQDFKAEEVNGKVPGAELTDEQKEYHQKAKDAGWNEPKAFDYEEHQRAGHDDDNSFGAGKVYEWNSEEYGEVGPAIPELEQMLFQGEFQQTQGEHMDALTFEVAIEGPSNDRISKVCEH